MKPWVLSLLLGLAATPCRAASEFVRNLQKAASRVEPEERMEYYSRAIRAWQPSESRTLLGQCHFGRGEARVQSYLFAEAEQDLTKALELDPGNARAFLLRGRAYQRLAKYSDAARDLIEYVGRNPLDLEGLLLLGEVELKAGRGDAALRAFLLAQRTEAADERAWLGEARAYMARKDWLRAERALDVADEKAGRGSAEVMTERAVCRVALGRLEEGRKDYSQALPLHARALDDLMRARRHAMEIAEQQDKTARAFFGRGRLNEFLVLHAEALADYIEACRHGHKDGCARAEALAPRAEPAPPKRPPPAENDPGERIYGG